MQLNSLVFGRLFTIPILKGSNSAPLERKQEEMKRMIELRELARTQLMSIEKLNKTGIKNLEDKSMK